MKHFPDYNDANDADSVSAYIHNRYIAVIGTAPDDLFAAGLVVLSVTQLICCCASWPGLHQYLCRRWPDQQPRRSHPIKTFRIVASDWTLSKFPLVRQSSQLSTRSTSPQFNSIRNMPLMLAATELIDPVPRNRNCRRLSVYPSPYYCSTHSTIPKHRLEHNSCSLA